MVKSLAVGLRRATALSTITVLSSGGGHIKILLLNCSPVGIRTSDVLSLIDMLNWTVIVILAHIGSLFRISTSLLWTSLNFIQEFTFRIRLKL